MRRQGASNVKRSYVFHYIDSDSLHDMSRPVQSNTLPTVLPRKFVANTVATCAIYFILE